MDPCETETIPHYASWYDTEQVYKIIEAQFMGQNDIREDKKTTDEDKSRRNGSIFFWSENIMSAICQVLLPFQNMGPDGSDSTQSSRSGF